MYRLCMYAPELDINIFSSHNIFKYQVKSIFSQQQLTLGLSKVARKRLYLIRILMLTFRNMCVVYM